MQSKDFQLKKTSYLSWQKGLFNILIVRIFINKLVPILGEPANALHFFILNYRA